jgi:hypothetical protein
MKTYYVENSMDAVVKAKEILESKKLPYGISGVYHTSSKKYRYLTLCQDTERKIRKQFYTYNRGPKGLDPEVEPSSSLGHIYDSVSISSSLLKILIIEAELHFSDDSVTNKLFGRQKIFSLNEMVRAYLEVLSYNEANRPRDRIHFHGVAKLFSRSIRLNFPFLGEKFNIHDEKSSIDGQFISDAAAHPFFNACTAARELCIYLKKMSFYRIFPKSTTNLICEHDTDLKHVKIYEISEGILVTVLDKTSILALPKYVLYFEDNEHVRRNLPFAHLLNPYFKYIQWP